MSCKNETHNHQWSHERDFSIEKCETICAFCDNGKEYKPASALRKFGRVEEYDADGYFLTSANHFDQSVRRPVNWTQSVRLPGLPHQLCERITQQGITIYGGIKNAQELVKTADRFPKLWNDQGGTAKISEKQWKIPLVPDWQKLYKPGNAKVYPLGQNGKKVVDAEFDKLHQQDRMEWATKPTSFSYSCFVV
ncbi:MAG: hypothetical protein M1817_001097 [Caeruleum heppii]|nr:MAG: hypothetical protein M1817_001097 [Caeruleum heppii]